MDKDFENWHRLKLKLDGRKNVRTFQEREIWWTSIGVNVGYEMYGKSQIFTRPVLVLRKFSHHTFLGIPLSTKQKQNPYYLPFQFQDREVFAVLSQAKTFDAKRFANPMGQLHEEEFEKIKQAFTNML